MRRLEKRSDPASGTANPLVETGVQPLRFGVQLMRGGAEDHKRSLRNFLQLDLPMNL